MALLLDLFRPFAAAITSTAVHKATYVMLLNRRVTVPVLPACPGCRRFQHFRMSRPCRRRLFPVWLGLTGTCATTKQAALETQHAASWQRAKDGVAVHCQMLVSPTTFSRWIPTHHHAFVLVTVYFLFCRPFVAVMEPTAAPVLTPGILTGPPAPEAPSLPPGSPNWRPWLSQAMQWMWNVMTRAAALQERPAASCRRASGAAAPLWRSIYYWNPLSITSRHWFLSYRSSWKILKTLNNWMNVNQHVYSTESSKSKFIFFQGFSNDWYQILLSNK